MVSIILGTKAAKIMGIKNIAKKQNIFFCFLYGKNKVTKHKVNNKGLMFASGTLPKTLTPFTAIYTNSNIYNKDMSAKKTGSHIL